MPGLFLSSGLWIFDPERERQSHCSLMPDHAGDRGVAEVQEPAGYRTKIPEGRPQQALFRKAIGTHPESADPPMHRQPGPRPATGEHRWLGLTIVPHSDPDLLCTSRQPRPERTLPRGGRVVPRGRPCLSACSSRSPSPASPRTAPGGGAPSREERKEFAALWRCRMSRVEFTYRVVSHAVGMSMIHP